MHGSKYVGDTAEGSQDTPAGTCHIYTYIYYYAGVFLHMYYHVCVIYVYYTHLLHTFTT